MPLNLHAARMTDRHCRQQRSPATAVLHHHMPASENELPAGRKGPQNGARRPFPEARHANEVFRQLQRAARSRNSGPGEMVTACGSGPRRTDRPVQDRRFDHSRPPGFRTCGFPAGGPGPQAGWSLPLLLSGIQFGRNSTGVCFREPASRGTSSRRKSNSSLAVRCRFRSLSASPRKAASTARANTPRRPSSAGSPR